MMLRHLVCLLLACCWLTAVSPSQAAQFALGAPPPISGLNLSATWTVDVDGDGDLDLFGIAPWFFYTAVYLLRNDGTGRFTDVTTAQMPGFLERVGDLVPFDCDGDGDLDLFLCGQSSSLLLRNNGAGTFTVATTLQYLICTGAAAADLDGDGDLDLALASVSILGGTNSLLINDGTGGFSAGPVFGFGGWARQVIALDLEGDGDSDLFYVGHKQLLRNDGNLAFTDVSATQVVLPAGLFAGPTDRGDVDGDGDFDLVIGDSAGVADSVVFDTGSVLQHVGALPPKTRTYALQLVDVDDDGDLDVVRSHDGNTLSLARNDGLGNFTDAATRLPPFPIHSTQVRAADLDGDGDTEVVTCFPGTPTLLLWNRHRHVEVGPAMTGQTWNVNLLHQPGYAGGDVLGLLAISLVRLPTPSAVPGIGDLWLDLGLPHLLVADVILQAQGVHTFGFAIPGAAALSGIELNVQGLIDAPFGPRLTALGVVVIQ
jgi:FG-GAP-like repeat